MPTTVVVGGQYGGEGKGKITSHIVRTQEVDLVVRCGGPNSGHTVTLDGKQTILRQVPAGVVKPGTKLALSAGCLVDEEILLKEIADHELDSQSLTIDRNAIAIKEEYKAEENQGLREQIASTATGTGVAVARRALREPGVIRASKIKSLQDYIGNVSSIANHTLGGGGRVVVEGTQGFGLSLLHSPYFPFTTSRDTTAASFLSESGISPITVDEVVLVLRTFPIRVGGQSGPLPNETTWQNITEESRAPNVLAEYTSVTKTLRRVAKFDISIVSEAASVNGATCIAINGVDYLDFEDKHATSIQQLTPRTRNFVRDLQTKVGVPIKYIGVGPSDVELLDLDSWKEVMS